MCSLLKAFQLLLFLFFLVCFQSNPSSCSSSTHLCSPEEAAALLQFKASFSIYNASVSSWICDNFGTKSYPKTNSWKDGSDCCSWDGVTCDHIKGHVIGLDLSCSQLYGSFPSNSTLFHLPHLQKLNLAFNFFIYSKMSSEFGAFASLVYLNLSSSFFVGPVPSQVSHLSKLVSLDLSRSVSLNLPWNDFQTLDKHTLKGLVTNLTKVRQLALDHMDMSSINPHALMNLSSSLRSLSLKHCDLRGNFPASIFHLPNLESFSLGGNKELILYLPKLNWSSNLERLDLSDMSLSTKSIDSINNLNSLKYLDLSHISVLGGLPEPITNLSSLELLDASYTSIFRGLPDSIGDLVSLEYLNLKSSYLSGSIPRSLENLSQLSHLDLSFNSFSGQIPSSLTNLTQLEFLDISGNQLEGSIPDKVTAFPKLISLDLSSNSLNGTLPSWLYTNSKLEDINLMNNQLSGDIKDFQYKSLEVISFGNNKLKGPLPSSISQLVNLTILDLSSNNLSGIVEFNMFSKLQNLQYLDLSYNSPSLNSNGTTVDYTLPNLWSLYLSFCNLSEFPLFLKGSQRLESLDLSGNKIRGRIPPWMGGAGKDSLTYLNLSHNSLIDFEEFPWQGIQYLDLSFNSIQGHLPVPPSRTQVFMISNNSLSGEIPSLICDAIALIILDLSYNNLSGAIPKCLGNLSQSLHMLNLQRNKLGGTIPTTFRKGCGLYYMNLNGNQLEGSLSRSIINCRGLQLLDLANNMINDTFPHWLGSLPTLKVLVLQSNKFHGVIHSLKSSPPFSKIQIFDLSNNYFTGPLPVQYLKKFKAMINTTEDSGVQYMGLEVVSTTRSNLLYLHNESYSYSIATTLKGQEIELKKIFLKYTSIDLSKNEFEGEIPKVIGELKLLKGLNISHNNLSGHIPASLGNLTALESLDLSSNKLVGRIPAELTSLDSLAVFNLSQNQLVGSIPQGKQFNTFGNDSYAGNLGLCGFPVSKSCDNTEAPVSDEKADSESLFEWKAALMGYGSGLVFGISAVLIMFILEKPFWLVRVVEIGGYRLKRYLRGRRIL